MCFSAEVSFGAGAVLLGVGVATALKIKQPEEILFASVPAVFSLQQFTEGVVWLSLSNPAYSAWQPGATFLFLIFAQVVWPLLVPLSLLLLEKEPARRNILIGLTIIGASVALYLMYRLLYIGATAQIAEHHISYKFDFLHGNTAITGIFYFIVTVGPLFVSGVKKIKILGVAILGSFLVTQFLYANYLISVWCFFAAIISLIVYAIMARIRKPVSVKGRVEMQGV